MTLVIGTDEAGYGPNLGPLVISATAWHIADRSPKENDQQAPVDLYHLLSEVVSNGPPSTGDDRLAIADSKRLYQPRGTLSHLEQGVLSALAIAESPNEQANPPTQPPGDWRTLLEQLDPTAAKQLSQIPWYASWNLALPTTSKPEQLSTTHQRFQAGLQRAAVRCLAVRSKVIFPEQFNQQVAKTGSKGEVLSLATLRLAGQLLDELTPSAEPGSAEAQKAATSRASKNGSPIHLVCDKHGGRNRYAPLLQEALGVPLVQVKTESRPISSYRFGYQGSEVAVDFQTGGESFLPCALASMTSKYVRELAMRAFNEFWIAQHPGLRPTAGYPGDAPRFHAEIATRQAELGISNEILWRNR